MPTEYKDNKILFDSGLRVTQLFGVNKSYYSKWGLQGHEGLPFLKFWIFSIIFFSMNPAMTLVTECRKILYRKISFIHVFMVNRKFFNVFKSNIFFFKTTYFTNIFSGVRIRSFSMSKIGITFSNLFYFVSPNFSIISSFGTNCLTFIRTIFYFPSSSNLISWTNKLFVAVQTRKTKLCSYFLDEVFLIFNIHNHIIPRSTKDV